MEIRGGGKNHGGCEEKISKNTLENKLQLNMCITIKTKLWQNEIN
jgi:hypothetical protein